MKIYGYIGRLTMLSQSLRFAMDGIVNDEVEDGNSFERLVGVSR
jgi:hypothetical protein